MPLHFRHAVLEDAASCAEIYRPYVEKTSITFEYIPPEEAESVSYTHLSYWEKNYDFVRCLLPQSQVLVWEQDGEVQGFAGIEGRNIEGIFVSTQFRSKGIGTAILQEAKRRFPSLTLQVYCKNRRAFLFYQREGFSIIKEEMDPDTGEAEYQMVWKKADGKED